jgi:tetratricopeptide (TPR) repeat protein
MFDHQNLPRAAERIARARLIDSLEPDVASMQSVWFRFSGEMDSAVAAAQVANRLDPLSAFFARLVGKQLYFARRYEESRVVYERMLRDDPGWTRGYLDVSQLYRAMGRPRDAVEWLRHAAGAAGDSVRAAALTIPATDADARRLLRADSRRVIAQLGRAARAGSHVPPSQYARAFAGLGDARATLNWLDSMITYRDTYLAQVRVDPLFDFVRKDLRYRAWEARSGLPLLAPPAIAQ